jgi:hypothetical protein
VVTSGTLICSRSSLVHTYIHRHTSMYVCVFAFLSIPASWLPNSDSLSFLIQSYIPTCIRCLTLCFSSIQVSFFGQQPAAVRCDQCRAVEYTVFLRGPRLVHVHTVDSGLWRLQLQRRLRRCAARPHRRMSLSKGLS